MQSVFILGLAHGKGWHVSRWLQLNPMKYLAQSTWDNTLPFFVFLGSSFAFLNYHALEGFPDPVPLREGGCPHVQPRISSFASHEVSAGLNQSPHTWVLGSYIRGQVSQLEPELEKKLPRLIAREASTETQVFQLSQTGLCPPHYARPWLTHSLTLSLSMFPGYLGHILYLSCGIIAAHSMPVC